MVSPVAAKAIEKVAEKYIERKGAGGGKGPSILGGNKLQAGIKIAKEIQGLRGGGEGASSLPPRLKLSGSFGKGAELGKLEVNSLGGKNGSNSLGDRPFKDSAMKAFKSKIASRIPGGGSFKAGMEMGEKWRTAQKKDTPKPGQQGDASKATDQQKDTPKPEDRQKDVPKPEQQRDTSKFAEPQKDVPKPEQQGQGDASTKPGDQPQEKDTSTTPEEVAAETAVEEVQTAAQETVEDLTEGSAQGDVSGTALDSVEAEYADYNPEEGIVTNMQSIEEDRIEAMQEQQETVKELEADAALGLPPNPSQSVEAENMIAIAHEGSAIDAELIDQSQNPVVDASNSSQSSEQAPQEVPTVTQEAVEDLTAGSAEGDVDGTNPDAVDAHYADEHTEEGIVTNAQTAEDRRIEEIQEQQQIVAEIETNASLGIAPDPSIVVEDANIQAIKDEGTVVDLQLIDQSVNPGGDTVTLSQTDEVAPTQLGEVMPESATVADQGVTPESSATTNQNVILENQIATTQQNSMSNETTSKDQKDSGLYIEFTDVQLVNRSGDRDIATNTQAGELGDTSVITGNEQNQPEDVEIAQQNEVAKHEQLQRELEKMLVNHQREIAELRAKFQSEQESDKKKDSPESTKKGPSTSQKIANALFANTGDTE